MPYTTEAKNRMLDALLQGVAPPAGVTHASLHTGDPGSTGANEVAGGAPAYARQAITWNDAAGGEASDDVVGLFDVPGATTVSHVGYWSGATFVASDVVRDDAGVPTPQVFSAQGTFTLSDTELNLHAT